MQSGSIQRLGSGNLTSRFFRQPGLSSIRVGKSELSVEDAMSYT